MPEHLTGAGPSIRADVLAASTAKTGAIMTASESGTLVAATGNETQEVAVMDKLYGSTSARPQARGAGTPLPAPAFGIAIVTARDAARRAATRVHGGTPDEPLQPLARRHATRGGACFDRTRAIHTAVRLGALHQWFRRTYPGQTRRPGDCAALHRDHTSVRGRHLATRLCFCRFRLPDSARHRPRPGQYQEPTGGPILRVRLHR